jgi:transcriptional regulator with XRE-family HTH domain
VTREPTFGESLRRWRERRGLSQLALAGEARVSQRHLSFLELGRTSPSRQMVDRLAATLGVPLRQHNALLLAAGFAPRWPQSELAAPDLTEVARALDHMLAQQEPYPAVVVDRCWNLLKSNQAALRLVEFLDGPICPGRQVNLADALVAPDGLRRRLVNWEEVIQHFVRSVEADAAADGLNDTATLFHRLMGYSGVRAALKATASKAAAGPVLAMHFRKDGEALRLFTTIATLGTPQNVTLQELRIECFFPLDEATGKLLRSWAKAPSPRRRTGARLRKAR